MDLVTDPNLRTRTRFGFGTDVGYRLTGHVVALGRLPTATAPDPRTVPLDTIGLVENHTGWSVRVGRSADGALTAPDGQAWTLLDLTVTDPTGRAEHLTRMTRPGTTTARGARGLASMAPITVPSLFESLPALSDPDYQVRCATDWARAQRIHAWAGLVTDFSAPPHGDTPWWRHPRVFHWVDWPDLDTATVWRQALGGRPSEALPYQRAGWTPDQARPWIERTIGHPVAAALAPRGWTADQAALLRHHVLPKSTYFSHTWMSLGAAEAWASLPHDPHLTVLAAMAGLTVDEAARVTDADRPGLTVLAAFHRDPSGSEPRRAGSHP